MVTPTDEQQTILKAAQAGESFIMRAAAGSAKTTTLQMVSEALPTNSSILVLAFNKKVQTELTQRLPEHCTCKTFNGYGAGVLFRNGIRPQLDAEKMLSINRDIAGDYGENTRELTTLTSLLKANAMSPEGYWEPKSLIDHYEISDNGNLAQAAKAALTESLANKKKIDFDDQLYVPIVKKLAFPLWDYILVDEAQDINHVQFRMIRKSRKRSTRIIAAGDPRQAIYGFRGSMESSIEELKSFFDMNEYPLTISFRCARSIVTEAQRYVDTIQPAPHAPEGVVETVSSVPNTTVEDSAVLCRFHAPLLHQCIEFLRSGIRFDYKEATFGNSLINTLRTFDSQPIETQLDKMKAQLKRLKGAKRGRLEEQYNAIIALNLAGYTTKQEMIRLLSEMIKQKGGWAISTIHSAKGLEWDTVFILPPGKGIEGDQEENLRYVSVTRAKSNLYYVRDRHAE